MSWEINGVTLEFDEETHTYLADGVIVPSVTQVLKAKFGEMYKGVSESVLNKASTRGIQVHEAIETYCKTQDAELLVQDEVRGFKFLCDRYFITPLSNEVPVLLLDNGKPIIAGRLDLLLDAGDVFALGDIKTTSTLNKDYLAYQLNLYRRAFEQSYGMDIEKLYGFHLRETKRKLVEIPINDFLVKEILELYKERLANKKGASLSIK